MSQSYSSHSASHSHGPGAANLPPLPASACSGCACSTSAGDGHDHGTLPGWPRIAAALALATGAEAAHWMQQDYAGMALAVVAIALSGLGVYRVGLKDLARLRLGIHALMAVAVTGAFLIGQWPEAAMVMALYVAAERIEDGAMDRARHAIRQLLQLAPATADVLQPNGSTLSLPVDQVPLGATVRIAPGAHVPLDGTVTHGSSSVNQAPITGESQLADKAAGDPLYAGSVNQQGELLMQVNTPPGDTLIARIVRAVEQAQASKAPIQRFVDRFAAIYTPVVFALAVLLALLAPPLMGWTWTQSTYQALALLVIACPCALVISTPVTVVSALTAAARRGILIKGGSALEAARGLRVVALDKTGTLTTGSPALVQWRALNGADADAVADVAWQLASRSEHPVSRAIAAGLPAATHNGVQNLQALPGRGVQAEVGGQRWWLGNLRLMREQGLADAALEDALAQQERQGRTVTLLADAQAVRALFAVADPLRGHARQAIAELRALGVHPVVLSGDNPATAQAIAAEAGITDALDALGGLLPQDKLDTLAALQRTRGPTAMAGDGINDAPALAQADVGFAMGGAHSTGMAMETADVVLMNDDLRRIPDTVRLARRAHAVLWQNITLALGIKAAFFTLALLGMASMWMAVAADMGVSLLVVANGLRLRRGASIAAKEAA
ncbi:heavy metal translocating P-type ATPase [Acidovorax sp. JS42]|nr:heavy metal translocating P-type ATPase [Acidovorax sp. JS42]